MLFVIFHGSFGSPEGNWFPWVKTELQKSNQDVFIPEFPVDTWSEVSERHEGYQSPIQNLTTWSDTFDQYYQQGKFNTKKRSVL